MIQIRASPVPNVSLLGVGYVWWQSTHRPPKRTTLPGEEKLRLRSRGVSSSGSLHARRSELRL